MRKILKYGERIIVKNIKKGTCFSGILCEEKINIDKLEGVVRVLTTEFIVDNFNCEKMPGEIVYCIPEMYKIIPEDEWDGK